MLSGDHGAPCVWRRIPICFKAEKFPCDDLLNDSCFFCPPAAHPGTLGSSRNLSGPFTSPNPQLGRSRALLTLTAMKRSGTLPCAAQAEQSLHQPQTGQLLPPPLRPATARHGLCEVTALADGALIPWPQQITGHRWCHCSESGQDLRSLCISYSKELMAPAGTRTRDEPLSVCGGLRRSSRNRSSDGVRYPLAAGSLLCPATHGPEPCRPGAPWGRAPCQPAGSSLVSN